MYIAILQFLTFSETFCILHDIAETKKNGGGGCVVDCCDGEIHQMAMLTQTHIDNNRKVTY